MDQRKASLSRAFFLELVLALAIFSFCAMICLQVFAQAKTESDRSAAITQLGVKAQGMAESFKSGGSVMVSVKNEASKQAGDTLYWYYDRDLELTQESLAYYTLSCTIDDSTSLSVATIALNEDQENLFKYDVSRYNGSRGVS